LVSTDRRFQIQITAAPGTGEITVEAQDVQGNSSSYNLTLSSNRRD
jgi:hypothetical protein